MSFGLVNTRGRSPFDRRLALVLGTQGLCPKLVLLARVMVIGSEPLVERISMNPHCFGRFGLVPLILFQSRHDELAFKLPYGFVVPQATINHFRDESFQLLFHDKLLQMSAT